jgi:antitoxin VapB
MPQVEFADLPRMICTDASNLFHANRASCLQQVMAMIASLSALAYAWAYADALLDGDMTIPERHVKLFKNGRNQAVRIPREFELPGDDAIIRKDGNKLIIEAAAPRSLLALLATLEPIDDDFPPILDREADEVEI